MRRIGFLVFGFEEGRDEEKKREDFIKTNLPFLSFLCLYSIIFL